MGGFNRKEIRQLENELRDLQGRMALVENHVEIMKVVCPELKQMIEQFEQTEQSIRNKIASDIKQRIKHAPTKHDKDTR